MQKTSRKAAVGVGVASALAVVLVIAVVGLGPASSETAVAPAAVDREAQSRIDELRAQILSVGPEDANTREEALARADAVMTIKDQIHAVCDSLDAAQEHTKEIEEVCSSRFRESSD